MNECDIEYPPCEGDDGEDPSVPEGMELRHMEPGDLIAVRRLHEQCFPVRYDKSFYENVVRGVIARGKGEAKEPLYTQVAVIPCNETCNGNAWGLSQQSHFAEDGSRLDAGYSVDGSSRYSGSDTSSGCDHYDESGAGIAGQWTGDDNTDGHAEDRVDPASATMDVDDHRGVGCAGSDVGDGLDSWRTREKIVGLITCQVVPLEHCRDRDRLGLGAGFEGEGLNGQKSEAVYILTLGTETSYRRRGIGRALLRRCVWLSRQESTIGAVYLHVITTNPPAHRFYESEGFVQLCCITEYYKINGKLYDCFIYALYVNGAQPREGWGWSIQSLSKRTLEQVLEASEREDAAVDAPASPGTARQDLQHDRQQDDENDEEKVYDRPKRQLIRPNTLSSNASCEAFDSGETGRNGVSGDIYSAGARAAARAKDQAQQTSSGGFAWSVHGTRLPAIANGHSVNSVLGNEDAANFVDARRNCGSEGSSPPQDVEGRPLITLWNAAASGTIKLDGTVGQGLAGVSRIRDDIGEISQSVYDGGAVRSGADDVVGCDSISRRHWAERGGEAV